MRRIISPIAFAFGAAAILVSCGAAPTSGAATSVAATANASAAPSSALQSVADAAVQVMLPKGHRLVARLKGDLNGDGHIDVAFAGEDADGEATLYFALGTDASTLRRDNVRGQGPLANDASGSVDLSIARGVLVVEFETGGTTRVDSTYRLRYDAAVKTMRLIGFDMSTYDKMLVHDTTDLSWNLLTGTVVKTVSKVRSGTSESFPASTSRSKRASEAITLDRLPPPYAIDALLTGG